MLGSKDPFGCVASMPGCRKHFEPPLCRYHAANVVLHASVCAALVILLRELSFSEPQVWLASSFFAVHPVHVEVIAGVVSRADLLSGMFYVGSLVAYIRGVKIGHARAGTMYRVLGYALWIAATLSKEVGFTVLAGFVFAEILFTHSKASPKSHLLSNKLQLQSLLHISISFIVAAIFMYFRLSLHRGAPLYQWTVMENQFSLMPNSLSRLLSILNTHAVYANLLIWPASLSFDHGFATLPVIHSPFDSQNWKWISLYVTFISLVTVCILKNKRRALWGVGIAVASFVPASNILIFVGTEVAERLLYIPTLGMSVALAALLNADEILVHPAQRLFCLLPVTRKLLSNPQNVPPVKRRHWVAFVMLLAFITGFAARSFTRCEDWRTEVGLYEAGVKTHPRSMKALNNYANLLMNKGGTANLVKAKSLLDRAIAIQPMSPALHNLGLTFKAMGNMTEALRSFWRAVGNNKTAPCTCYMDLAEIYMEDVRALDSDSLVETSSELLAMEPVEAAQFWEASVHQHFALSKPGGRRSANMVKALTERASSCSQPTFRLAMLRTHITSCLGSPIGAVQECSNALARARTAEEQASAHSLLGLLSQDIASTYQAEFHLKAAMSTAVAPSASHYTNYGIFLGHQGKYEKAEKFHIDALGLAKTNEEAGVILNNLMEVLFMGGKFQRVIDLATTHAQVNTSSFLSGRIQDAQTALTFSSSVLNAVNAIKSSQTAI